MAAAHNADLDMAGNDIVNNVDGTVSVKLGDAAGADSFIVKDSGDVVVFDVDSDGRIKEVLVEYSEYTGSDHVMIRAADGSVYGVTVSDVISPLATDAVAGKIEIATQTEVNTGTSTDQAVTPATLANYTGLDNLMAVVQQDAGDPGRTLFVQFAADPAPSSPVRGDVRIREL